MRGNVLNLLLLATFFCITSTSASERVSLSVDARRAFAKGAIIDISFRIVNSIGKPVEDAQVKIALSQEASEKFKSYSGMTDTNGNWRIAVNCSNIANVRVMKEGYYETRIKRHLFSLDYADVNSRIKGKQWSPWEQTVVLKEKRAPVPLACIGGDFVFPSDTVVGFDLVKGDWVTPFGTGKLSDLAVFYTAMNPANRFSIAMTNQIRIVASTNGGFIPKTKDTFSQFLSAYEAPEDGYMQELVYGRKSNEERILERTSLAESDYLIFKTRVETNEQGKVSSAQYGKI